MRLINFFLPLTPLNLLLFLCVMFTFDIVGGTASHLLSIEHVYRPIHWILGLSLIVFEWFILHIFIPFSPTYVILTFVLNFLILLPFYIKYRLFSPFISILSSLPILIVVLGILVYPIFILSSAPPFAADEMAYHYYSPFRLNTEKHWTYVDQFTGYSRTFYDLYPRFLDTSYILMFSISKTYVLARLIHFFIFLSSLFTIALILKRRLNNIVASAYFFIAVFFMPLLISSATTGYVDVAAAVLVNLFVVSLADNLLSRKFNPILAVLLGLAIGTKFTTIGISISALIAFVCVCILLKIINRKKLSLRPTREYYFKLKHLEYTFTFLVILSLFGGYYYIRNLFVTYNPIYPLFFPCKYDQSCGLHSSNFFSGWATPIIFSNAIMIIQQVFQNYKYVLISIIAIVFTYTTGWINHKMKMIYLLSFILFSIIIEVIVSSRFLGFELRYFYHWSLTIPFILASPYYSLVTIRRNHISFYSISVVVFLFIYSFFLARSSYHSIIKIYSQEMLPTTLRDYAFRKINLNDWITKYFPITHEIVFWCSEDGKVKKLYTTDPDLIWRSYEGLSRIFLKNCELGADVPPENISFSEAEKSIIIHHSGEWLISSAKCGDPIPERILKENDSALTRWYEFDRYLICKRKEVVKNLYKL